MKTKILLLAANPKETDSLRLAEEFREIKESLKLSRHRDHFELVQGDAVRAKDLRRLVLEEQPHIIHLSGHGTAEGICLEDEQGNAHQVSGESLAGLFKHFDMVQAVMLNACYSETQAQAIAEVTPYVIGMNSPIQDQAAILFSIGFYDAIAAQKNIKKAFEIGVNAIEMAERNAANTRSLKTPDQKNENQAQAKAQTHIPVLIKGKITRAMPTYSEEKTVSANPAIKAAWIGGGAVIVAAIIGGMFTFKSPKPDDQAGGISAQQGDINISSSGNSQTIVATGNAVINYHGADPNEVTELKKQLKLKDRTIETLLNTIDAKQVPNNERTQTFKELAFKYKELQERLKQYENNSEFGQEAKEALESGDLDRAEQLLEQANKLDSSKSALMAWQQLQLYAERQQDHRMQRVGLSGEADILAAHGSGNLAMDKYQQAHQWFEERSRRDPNNADWQRDLSVSYDRIGDMYKANGEGQQAIEAYQEALNIRETLAKRDPNHSDWQRDLSISYDRIGDMYKANGEGQQAIEAYQEALNIRETLAKRDPNHSDWQRDLLVSYERIGDMHQANSEGQQAIKAYQDSIAIWKKLIALDPNNMEWQKGITVPYDRIGDMHQANGEGQLAIEAYQEALNIREMLAKRDPNHSDWQRGLLVSFNKLGDMHKANGEGQQAIEAYQDSLKIAETLAKRDPNHSDWQRDLSVSYERIGDMYKANGEGQQAIEAYQEAFNIKETLAKRDPNNTNLQRDLIVSYVKMSQVFPKQKKPYLEKALSIVLKLKEQNRLYQQDYWMIEDLKKRVAEAR